MLSRNNTGRCAVARICSAKNELPHHGVIILASNENTILGRRFKVISYAGPAVIGCYRKHLAVRKKYQGSKRTGRSHPAQYLGQDFENALRGFDKYCRKILKITR